MNTVSADCIVFWGKAPYDDGVPNSDGTVCFTEDDVKALEAGEVARCYIFLPELDGYINIQVTRDEKKFRRCKIDGPNPLWLLTGEDQDVSLQPSIRTKTSTADFPEYHWHGWLRDGRLHACRT